MDELKMITTDQLAERWGYSKRHIQRMRADGDGPLFMKFGAKSNSRVMYQVKDVLEFERAHLMFQSRGEKNGHQGRT